jgi:hypothetical protein
MTFTWKDLGHVCDKLLRGVLFGLSSFVGFCLVSSSYVQIPFAKFAHLALRSEGRLSLG